MRHLAPGLVLAAAFGAAACTGGVQHVQGCEPAEGLTPVCGFHNPEDLAAAGPQSPWLVVSQFPASLMPGAEGGGDLIAFHTGDDRRVKLFPADDAVGPAELGDTSCTAPPDAALFAPHGIDLADCLFLPLEAASGRRKAGATEFDGEPARRAIAVTDADTVERGDLSRGDLSRIDGLAVYAPITKRYV